jgi:hypothetical protein
VSAASDAASQTAAAAAEREQGAREAEVGRLEAGAAAVASVLAGRFD